MSGSLPPTASHNFRDDERQAIDQINRDHQNGALSGLFPSLDRIQIDEVNLATSDGHQYLSRPSASVAANS